MTPSVFAKAGSQERSGARARRGSLSTGDAALLRFAAAAEILESDFWIQYNELGGVQDSEVPGGSGSPVYTAKLANLDADFPQYVHDNTDDEITHFTFLNAYLVANGADPVDLEQFRTLPGRQATGSSGKLRLTNLMQLTLDTSWYKRSVRSGRLITDKMKAMQEQFSDSEVSTLRSYLLETLLDTNQAAEVLQMFLIGHGYGISPDAAIEAATKAMAARMSLVAIREELERVALVT